MTYRRSAPVTANDVGELHGTSTVAVFVCRAAIDGSKGTLISVSDGDAP